MTSRMFFTTLFSAVGAAGIVLFGSDAIEANVKPTISTEAQPLPVVVVPFQLERSYKTTTRFLGVVEASSDSNVGFEVADDFVRRFLVTHTQQPDTCNRQER